ncbi:MAG TPA: nuclear transport factor 2 family protein [Lacisediminihabitans sp.]|uniref:nuclear transport factor 2 family protein n=1 Tax=Lacisediminihabitans sp. TaxID=2787631 RepID=UPI002ED90461
MVALPAPIQRMVDATNAADTETFLATFADDAYLVDWGREFHGRDGVARWNRSDNIGKHAHFEATACRQEADEQVVTLVVSGGGYNGTGDIRFTLEGDLISRMIIA